MTMPGYQTYSPPAPPERKGLAVTSLVLGVVGLPALLLCGLGLGLAAVGLLVGIIAVSRGAGRRTAIMGVICSAVTLVIGGIAIFFLLSKAAECADPERYPDESARRGCVEREFPFARHTETP
ncbi:hypothetical protein [Actinomadura rudentiformis]|uniref:DUF4190 domain-containing protein n=1 Tax=Actinomadura rudentiformis TaxID=359158 RepID=A0A6H9YLX0_9ACTN|nr:hypothetical protein [Actinomadura rudentiformis]KAB2348380.1 hypothetical protein F8566_16450 [Actinomadura rudentiformis]